MIQMKKVELDEYIIHLKDDCWNRPFYWLNDETKKEHIPHLISSDVSIDSSRDGCEIVYYTNEYGIRFYLGSIGGKMVTNFSTVNLDARINELLELYNTQFDKKIKYDEIPLIEKHYHPDGPIGSLLEAGIISSNGSSDIFTLNEEPINHPDDIKNKKSARCGASGVCFTVIEGGKK